MAEHIISELVAKLSKTGQKSLVLEHDRFGRPSISLNRLTQPSKVEQHDMATDVIHILEGAGTYQRGGTIEGKLWRSQYEWRGTSLTETEEVRLGPGLILTTPAGIPHKTLPEGKDPLIYLAFKQYHSDYPMTEALSDELRERIQNIKGILMDVDGVMTDGKVWVNERGEESVSFSRIDSIGRKRLQERGIKLAMISHERVVIAKFRAKKLRIDCFNGIDDKKLTADKITKKWKLSLDEICFIGDDINDLDLLQRVGLSVCPSDASVEVLQSVDLVLPKKRGNHVLRELFDLIYQIQYPE